MIRLNAKLPVLLLAAAVGLSALTAANWIHTVGKKEEKLVEVVVDGLHNLHFLPEKIDDQFSERVYDLYMKELDRDKRFFTKKDVKKLQKYRKLVDNELNDLTFDFYTLASSLQKERLIEIEKWYKEFLAKPMDYKVEEELETDEEKRDFAEDMPSLKDYWHKSIKLQVMNRIAGLMDEDEKAAEKAKEKKDETFKIRSFEEVEVEARKKVTKTMDDWFKRLRGLTDAESFSMYVNAVASAYDPHTNYFAPEEKKDFDMTMSGKLEGIGATLQEKEGYIRVTSLVAGGPAWKQGKLKVDDLITKVAQKDAEPVDVLDMPINDVIKMIRGKKGTEVRLTIKKPDGSIVIVPIIRDIVELEDGFAKSCILNQDNVNIGYIHLPRFYADFEDRNGRRCAKDVKIEVEKLKAEGVQGIVIDLRNNGGGSLNDVVDMGGLFIDKGPIVQVKSREGEPEAMNDRNSGTIYDGPLVIMVNQYSASASEILAAAMQDYERAVIIGTGPSTFGKGTVQRMIDLDRAVPFAMNDIKPLGSIKMTVQKFYRINGGTTQLQGVIPDIILPDTYSYIDKYGEKEEDYPLKWDEIKPLTYSKTKSFSLAQVKQKSADRIAKDKHFKLVNENALRIKKEREKTSFSLNWDKYRAYDKEQDAANKDLKDASKEDMKFAIRSLTADLPKINQDSATIEKAQKWHKDLKKDIYINESISVIKDILPK